MLKSKKVLSPYSITWFYLLPFCYFSYSQKCIDQFIALGGAKPKAKVVKAAGGQAKIVAKKATKPIAQGTKKGHIVVATGGKKVKKPIVVTAAPQGNKKTATKAQSAGKAQPPTRPVGFGGHAVAMQTARVIATTPSHRRHTEVAELVRTFEKGWIDELKFAELLQGLLF